jgi:hypothetical protein
VLRAGRYTFGHPEGINDFAVYADFWREGHAKEQRRKEDHVNTLGLEDEKRVRIGLGENGNFWV